jgi:Xaa-Pro aminopeptidase
LSVLTMTCAVTSQRREFITGFTGSAGTAVVAARKALLWTDGRYFLQVWEHNRATKCTLSRVFATQAEQELSEDWTLMKQGIEGVPKVCAVIWLCDSRLH